MAEKPATDVASSRHSSQPMTWQLFVNSLIVGAPIAVLAVGFALIYRVASFVHFTHGGVFTVGAYVTFTMHIVLGMPLLLSAIAAVLGCAGLGCVLERFIFRHLQATSVQPLVPLLASLGGYIILQNVLSLAFGDETLNTNTAVVAEGLHAWGARITPIQLTILCISAAALILVDTILRFTTIGEVLRAVADDPELATIRGVPTDVVVMGVFALGSALAGLAGLLTAWDVNAHPTMGLNPLMFAVVAMIVGGTRLVWGIAAGTLLLALARNFGVWRVSSQWQDAVVFVILILFLLFRPQGFYGKPPRSAAS